MTNTPAPHPGQHVRITRVVEGTLEQAITTDEGSTYQVRDDQGRLRTFTDPNDTVEVIDGPLPAKAGTTFYAEVCRASPDNRWSRGKVMVTWDGRNGVGYATTSGNIVYLSEVQSGAVTIRLLPSRGGVQQEPAARELEALADKGPVWSAAELRVRAAELRERQA